MKTVQWSAAERSYSLSSDCHILTEYGHIDGQQVKLVYPPPEHHRGWIYLYIHKSEWVPLRRVHADSMQEIAKQVTFMRSYANHFVEVGKNLLKLQWDDPMRCHETGDGYLVEYGYLREHRLKLIYPPPSHFNWMHVYLYSFSNSGWSKLRSESCANQSEVQRKLAALRAYADSFTA